MSDFANVRKISAIVPISEELAMDYGLIPDTRPPRPPLPRRVRLRWWWQERFSVYAIRLRLSAWIDPNDDDCGCYR